MDPLDALHECQNPDCRKSFPHRRRGGNVFCGECREYRWKATQNARQALHRLDRRAFLGLSVASLVYLQGLLESRPSTKTGYLEQARQELQALDILIQDLSPSDPKARHTIKTRAQAVIAALPLKPTRTRDDERLIIQAHELLRDVGAEGEFTPENAQVLFRHAWTVADFYERTKDWPNLAKALLALASLYREVEDDLTARKISLDAYHILHERCDRKDPRVATFLHQAIFWWLRLAKDNPGNLWGQRAQEFIELAEEINTPEIWLETYREQAGWYNYIWRLPDKGTEHLQQMRAYQEWVKPRYATPTLLRPEIELLLIRNKKEATEKAIDVIQNQYLAIYQQGDRHSYFFKQLQRWSDRFGLALQLPPPTYTSAVLIYLPRG